MMFPAISSRASGSACSDATGRARRPSCGSLAARFRPIAGKSAGEAAATPGPRLAPAAVADALTTAFMLLPEDAVAGLCDRSPGLEAWLLPDGATGLHHFGAGILAPGEN